MAINWTDESLNPGYPQAGMKGAPKGGTKTNTTLERGEPKNGVGNSVTRSQRGSALGLCRAAPAATDFSDLPNELPSF